MKLPIYQVDAFADKLFSGNPAAIVPLKKWISEDLMQSIATENNLAETAFFVEKSNEFEIRWFTPAAEINLCGHATLGSAFILYEYLDYSKKKDIVFHSQSGVLTARKDDGIIWLDFPSWKPERVTDIPADLQASLGSAVIKAVYKFRDWVVELDDEEAVKRTNPDFAKMKAFGHNVMVTAAGNEVDFVSRFFAPALGIDEDPVTGSAHSQLIPFWSERLGKKEMRARQLSKRGGELACLMKNDRIEMGGSCKFYMKGKIVLG